MEYNNIELDRMQRNRKNEKEVKWLEINREESNALERKWREWKGIENNGTWQSKMKGNTVERRGIKNVVQWTGA